MPVLRYYSSNAQPAQLVANINASTTSLTVDTTVGYPTLFPFTIAVDWGTGTEELMDVTAVVGAVLTVTRGVDGTSAQSHGVGAAVRHVASGRDFADYQNHQAATSGVHGVAGTLVGTSDVQTLSNKTLSGAALSGGGSIAGTWTGSPTFSGSVTLSGGGSLSGTWAGTPTFSGAHTHSAAISSVQAAAGSVALDAKVTGDTQTRFQLTEDGSVEWGSGSATRDTFMARTAAGALLFNNTALRATQTTGSNAAISSRVTGDANGRWSVRADGVMVWSDGTAAADVNLYRSAADVLRTDDSLIVGAGLTVNGVGQVLAAYKTADTGRTTATLSDDPHLTFTVSANAVYTVEGYLNYSTTDETNADLALAWTLPASATGRWSSLGQGVSATTTDGTVRTVSNAWSTGRNYGALIASELSTAVRGTLVTAGSGGTFALQFARTGGAGTVTLTTHSYLILTRIA